MSTFLARTATRPGQTTIIAFLFITFCLCFTATEASAGFSSGSGLRRRPNSPRTVLASVHASRAQNMPYVETTEGMKGQGFVKREGNWSRADWSEAPGTEQVEAAEARSHWNRIWREGKGEKGDRRRRVMERLLHYENHYSSGAEGHPRKDPCYSA